MASNNYAYDWNQHQSGDTSLHSVHGEIHAGPHSIPAHADSSVDPSLLAGMNTDDSGAFVKAGTAGQQGFDVRSLGLSEQELQATGLHPSFLNTGRQLPLDQYKINYDPNPIVIRKQIPMEMPTYKQQVIVRYLRPPTPPSPGPLIVKEVREPQAAPAPPLVIRTRAPREKTPPPIVIREAPPPMPHIDRQPQYVNRVIRQNETSYQMPTHQQYQHYESYTNNYNPTTGNQEETAWVTEIVSNDGKTSAAPAHLLDHIYQAMNNQIPRV